MKRQWEIPLSVGVGQNWGGLFWTEAHRKGTGVWGCDGFSLVTGTLLIAGAERGLPFFFLKNKK